MDKNKPKSLANGGILPPHRVEFIRRGQVIYPDGKIICENIVRIVSEDVARTNRRNV